MRQLLDLGMIADIELVYDDLGRMRACQHVQLIGFFWVAHASENTPAVTSILPAKLQPNPAAGARYQCSFHIFLLMRTPGASSGDYKEYLAAGCCYKVMAGGQMFPEHYVGQVKRMATISTIKRSERYDSADCVCIRGVQWDRKGHG
jgi:hypothetical protein